MSNILLVSQYPMELTYYFKHKPWDYVTLVEAIRKDKTGLIKKAYECSTGMHYRTFRRDGQKALSHPLKVVKILIYYGVDDPNILAAAFLHDAPEDNDDEVLEIIKESYLEDVYSIVYGVTKSRLMTKDEHFALVEEDCRRIILKLADRLHNLRNMSKNLYYTRDFTKGRLRRYKLETIKYIYPLGEKISNSDYKYALVGKNLFFAIKLAVFMAGTLLTVPKADIIRYQKNRKGIIQY